MRRKARISQLLHRLKTSHTGLAVTNNGCIMRKVQQGFGQLLQSDMVPANMKSFSLVFAAHIENKVCLTISLPVELC